MFSKKAVAVLSTIIFVLIFSILSGVLLSIVSSSTRTMEAQTSHIKAFYASEAGLVYTAEALRRGKPVVDFNIPWTLTADSAGTVVQYKQVSLDVKSIPWGSSGLVAKQIHSNVSYGINW